MFIISLLAIILEHLAVGTHVDHNVMTISDLGDQMDIIRLDFRIRNC